MIKSNIINLYNILNKKKLGFEADFIRYLIVTAGYDDDWREKINNLAKNKKYPFASWFPDGSNRVTLEFKREIARVNIVVQYEVEKLNATITDYMTGMATDKYGRAVKIGKLLSQEINKLEKLYLSEQDEKNKNDIELNIIELKNALDLFNNDLNRSNKDAVDLDIIISQDPHDIAQASYERSWESCFNIGDPSGKDKGSNSESVFCEIMYGGLIAYLVRKEDTDITFPIARLLIRRYSNQSGKNIAVPENKVYGTDINGFKSAVEQWINKHNKYVDVGFYNIQGGEYSDTLDEIMVFSKDADQAIEFLSKKDDNKYTYHLYDNDYDLLNENGFWEENQDPYKGIIKGLYDKNNDDEDFVPEKIFESESEAYQFINKIKDYSKEDYLVIKLLSEGIIDNEREYYEDADKFEELYFNEFIKNRFEINEDKNNSKKYKNNSIIRHIYENVLKNSNYLTKDKIDYIDSIINDRDYEIFKHVKKLFYELYPNKISKNTFLDMASKDRAAILNDHGNEYANNEERKNELMDYVVYQINDDLYRLSKSMEKYPSENLKEDKVYKSQFDIIMQKYFYSANKEYENTKKYVNSMIEKINNSNLYENSQVELTFNLLKYYERLSNLNKDNIELLFSILKHLMDYYDYSIDYNALININSIGLIVSKFGIENEYAKHLLPFFYKHRYILNNTNTNDLNTNDLYKINDAKRKVNYVIDSLENGTGTSKKYSWQ
jgi:hypothetical protein